MVLAPSGGICPHQSDQTAHRNVRPARRLTFRRGALSYCWDEHIIHAAEFRYLDTTPLAGSASHAMGAGAEPPAGDTPAAEGASG